MEEKKTKKIKPWMVVLIVIGAIFALYMIIIVVHQETCGTFPGEYLDCMPPYESEEYESLCERAQDIPWCRVVW